MKKLVALLMVFPIIFSMNAAEPEIEIKDIRIDNRLINPQIGRIDTTSGTLINNWTAVILELDVKIPDSKLKNKFQNGKWLDSLTVEWNFMYNPPRFEDHIKNYMRFSRSVTYKHIPEGENKVSILIEPAVMKRYFSEEYNFKRNLLSKIVIKHKGVLKEHKIFRGEREEDSDMVKKAFLSLRPFHLKDVLKTRLETPFRSLQTAEFLSISKK